MSIYIQIAILVSLLIGLGTYILFKRRKKKASKVPIISEEDLKPYFNESALQKEEKVRKQWLNSFIIRTAIIFCGNFLEVAGHNLCNDFVRNLLCSVLIGSLLSLPHAWTTYHCSYKKRGTAWLLWTMIILPLVCLISIAALRYDQVITFDTPLAWFILTVFLGIDVYYWVNCLRMYKVNLFRKIMVSKILALSEEDLKPYFSGSDIQKEKKIRKQWLISLFIYAASMVTTRLLYFGIPLFYGLVKGRGFPLMYLLRTLGGSFIYILPWFLITYYCSYKKSGRAWLMCTMIMLPLIEFGNIAGGGWNNVFACDPLLGWSVVTVSVGFDIFYLVNCLRLYRVNSSRKKKRALAIQEKYRPDAMASVLS
jgi:hypothetical protein